MSDDIDQLFGVKVFGRDRYGVVIIGIITVVFSIKRFVFPVNVFLQLIVGEVDGKVIQQRLCHFPVNDRDAVDTIALQE